MKLNDKRPRPISLSTTKCSSNANAHRTVAGGHLPFEEAEKMKCNLPKN